MESINAHLARIDDLIVRLEELVDASRPAAFSNKISVDKNKVFDIIDELRPCLDDIASDLPGEILKARRVVDDSEKILEDAQSKADMIRRSAESDIEKRVAEHEIAKQAREQADTIVDDARKFAKELRNNALEYADEKLKSVEDAIRESVALFAKSVKGAEASFNETIDLIYDNRQDLRAGDKGR